MDTVQAVGAWSTFSNTISAEAQNAFDTAFKGFVGVSYAPFAVATQVVSGINYRFLCNSKVIYPGALNQASLVEIYQPAEGDIHITSIKRIDQ